MVVERVGVFIYLFILNQLSLRGGLTVEKDAWTGLIFAWFRWPISTQLIIFPDIYEKYSSGSYCYD